ncbi:hypothetical protein Lepto7375DRAFT_1047 [Leptolyngbya sp. PCC 7375]|nr:hypothetical protein Lepto7375DRAFT_1047 [Leptolyngbya sp. PCC 7375]
MNPKTKQRSKRRPRRQRRYRLITSSLLMLLSFSLGFGLRFQAKAASAKKDLCQNIISSQAVLSRQQLTQLLTVPERENRQAIEAIAEDPYCTLTAIEVRAGVTAERVAYPLAFDPNTWLVVLYEDEEYAGYGFKLQH